MFLEQLADLLDRHRWPDCVGVHLAEMKIRYHSASWPERLSHPGQYLAPEGRLGVLEETKGGDEIKGPRRQARVNRDITLNQHCARAPRPRQLELRGRDVYAGGRGKAVADKLHDLARSAGKIGERTEIGGDHIFDNRGNQSPLDQPFQTFRRTLIARIFVRGLVG